MTIDLRSDTVTRPTEVMLEAMRHAPLGDDGREGDPTVIALEALAAERTGKEAGLFVSSGTMGNLVALLAHTGRGGEAVGHEARADRAVAGERGAMDVETVRGAISASLMPNRLA